MDLRAFGTTAQNFKKILDKGKTICRAARVTWTRSHGTLAVVKFFKYHEHLLLCTDLPEQASRYFGNG